MDKEQKAALVEEIAERLGDSEAIFAVDYRGISVPQAAELRTRLAEADATFRVVKNRLAKLAAEKAGTAELEGLLEGPIALTFVRGDAVTAAKAIATFARQNRVLEYRGGLMDGAPLAPETFGEIARLPALDVLHGQLVGVTASPLTGLTRGLAAMLSGLAVGLGEIRDKGLVNGEAPAEEAEPPGAEAGPAAEEASGEGDGETQVPVEEAEDPEQQEEGSAEQEVSEEAATGEDAPAEDQAEDEPKEE